MEWHYFWVVIVLTFSKAVVHLTAPLSENDCPFNEFKCITKYGRVCLSNNWKCDGRADCEDAFDEQNCTACNPSLWACHCSNPAKLACIHPSWRCDGMIECEDNSDEMDCDKKVEEGKVTGSPIQQRIDAKVHPPMTEKPDPISGNMNSDSKTAPKMTDYPTDYSPRRRHESYVEVELTACFSVLGSLMVMVTIALVFIYRRHREILCAIFKQPITKQRSTPSNSLVMNDVHNGAQIREETSMLDELAEMSVNTDEQRKRRQPSNTTQTGKEMSQHQPRDDYFPEMAEHDLDELKKLEENRLVSAALDNFIPAGDFTHRIYIAKDCRYHTDYEDTEVKESATDCDMDLDQVEEREKVEEKRNPDTMPEEKLPRNIGFFNSLERIPKNSEAIFHY